MAAIDDAAMAWSIEVEQEAERLLALSPPQARAELGNRIARAFLGPRPDITALDFNANLATRLRMLAGAGQRSSLWSEK